jgi:methyl-accepting chemotaxis protein
MPFSISTRLNLLAAIGSLSLVALGAAGATAATRIGDALERAADLQGAALDAELVARGNEGLRGDLHLARAADGAAGREILTGVPARVDALRARARHLRAELGIDGRADTEPVRRSADTVEPLLAAYWRAATDAAGPAPADDPAAAPAALDTVDRTFAALEAPLLSYSGRIGDEARDGRGAAEERVSVTAARLWAGTLVAAALVAGLGLWTRASVLGPLRRLARSVRALGTGDLRGTAAAPAAAAGDELDRIHHDLDAAVASVRTALSAMDGETRTLRAAADEFTNIAKRMMVNAQGTSSAAQQVSTAAGEVAERIRTVAHDANTVSSTTAGISRSSAEAGDVALEVVAGVGPGTRPAGGRAAADGRPETTGSPPPVAEVIARIDSLQSAIAGAVAEQATATQGIERSADSVSAVTGDITARIDRIADNAAAATEAAVTAERAAAEVARMAVHLAELLDRFRY